MAEALLAMVNMIEEAYNELYKTQGTEEALLDYGFARGLFHARLEGVRDGIQSGLEQQPTLPW